MKAAGLIFSNIHDGAIPELTRIRTMASIPFGGRFRMVDFPLSAMVNAGITTVGIITHFNYQSLLDHIGNGKDWDLARRSGGIRILPPFITAYDSGAAGKLYETRLEALMGVTSFVSHCQEDTIVLSDCDIICSLDLKDLLAAHAERNADVTVVTKTVSPSFSSHTEGGLHTVKTDIDGRIVELSLLSPEREGDTSISANIFVCRRSFLLEFLQNAQARGWKNFYTALSRYLLRARIFAYRFDGVFSVIDSLRAYYDCNMQLLDPAVQAQLLDSKTHPVHTKVRNSPPTAYLSGAQVKNSLIADGCTIDGTVENCILFRGVRVGRGCVVRNSILMQDTYLGDRVELDCVITDKNVAVRDGRTLSGDATLPFFIGKGKMI